MTHDFQTIYQLFVAEFEDDISLERRKTFAILTLLANVLGCERI